jgi:peptide deformylase
MVFNPSGEPGEGEEMVLVNPVIYKSSNRYISFNEGCLSFPGIYADVEVRSTIFLVSSLKKLAICFSQK